MLLRKISKRVRKKKIGRLDFGAVKEEFFIILGYFQKTLNHKKNSVFGKKFKIETESQIKGKLIIIQCILIEIFFKFFDSEEMEKICA